MAAVSDVRLRKLVRENQELRDENAELRLRLFEMEHCEFCGAHIVPGALVCPAHADLIGRRVA
jgi:hypothetical protein